MALTISSRVRTTAGHKHCLRCNVAFDSSYAFGGESLDYTQLGFDGAPERVRVMPKNGFVFDYDVTNKKLKAFAPAPPIVFEESVTVTSNVGTLQYPAAYIMYVSSGNAGYQVIPGGLTPVSGSVAVSAAAWGTRPTLTFLAGDSVTSCKVTYVTQAWKDVFDNIVTAQLTAGARVSGHASLTFTAGTPDVISLGELAVAIQNITWDDNGTYKPAQALYKAETAATTEATIDFSDTTTKIAVLQTDTWDAATDSVYITYIKKPSSGFLADRLIEEDDLTPSTDVVTLSSGLAISNALLYGTCGQFPGPTLKFADIIAQSATVGTTATLIQPTTAFNSANTFTLGSDHGDTDHLKPTYICGHPSEIPGLVPLEVRNGTDLSDVTGVAVEIIGQ